MNCEKMLTSRLVYQGKILNLRVDHVVMPNGRAAVREVIEHSGACGIICIDKGDRILMVKQYRYPLVQYLLELPAGKIEGGETPWQCAARELCEETGYAPVSLKPFATIYPAAAYLTEAVYLFLCEGFTQGRQNLDEDENLSVEWVLFDDAVKMVLAGEICDSKTQIAILKTALLRQCPQLNL